jgi:hypothetical protein
VTAPEVKEQCSAPATDPTLEVWLSSGLLQKHAAGAQEIAELLALVERDLAESQSAGLSHDWRLTMAYIAALQAAKAALAAAGYEVSPDEKGYHDRLVESLRYTVGLPGPDLDLLQQMRKKGHASDYAGAGPASDLDAVEMYELAMRIRSMVDASLFERRPDLVGY